MKVKDFVTLLLKLDQEKDIFINVPDTDYCTDIFFNTEIDDTVFSSFDEKVGWYRLSNKAKSCDREHYVLYLWL